MTVSGRCSAETADSPDAASAALAFGSGVTAAPIKVVTTTMDLKSITEMIGGNKVSVLSIATGYQNPHFVDPKPPHSERRALGDFPNGIDHLINKESKTGRLHVTP